MCCQTNITWFWVCDRGQARSQEPAELHCPEQFPDQINTSQMAGDGSSSLMYPQIVLQDVSSVMVWWSSTHFSTACKKQQSPNILGMDKQLTSFQPARFLTEQLPLFPSPPLLSSLLVVFCRHFPQMALLEPNWNKRPYPHSALSPLTTKYFQSVERVFSSLFRVLWLPAVTAVSVWFEGSFACAVTGSFC